MLKMIASTLMKAEVCTRKRQRESQDSRLNMKATEELKTSRLQFGE